MNDTPPRREKVRSGYEGKLELGVADDRLRRALSRLARDKDPAARTAGVRIAGEAATLLHRLAADAEEASSATKAQRERMRAHLRRAEEKLRETYARRGLQPPELRLSGALDGPEKADDGGPKP
ncbi:hypothetical protein DPM19_18170 [Actinomadura craniellae]|uniref:Uncharacterized protein n=1 Tax=Actinomadura craniellae TaxID=2231787 RepID=A0A365H3B9_9ACTN|nr:hypothetical protein [Actinomadura craniellae]RAY13605.1 hypothetical protein DPM19_18170 [Actinomadura craniellae]